VLNCADWELTFGATNIPLIAQRRYQCGAESGCVRGFHYCVIATVGYWDTEAGGEWHWHLIDTRRDRPGDSVVRLDRSPYTEPSEAMAKAEQGTTLFLAGHADCHI
jgi:hypothetical protein